MQRIGAGVEACAQLLNKVKVLAEPKETHYVWEEVRREGRIETFVREPELRYSQARMPAPQVGARFRFWNQILKQLNGTWWSFYAEASS